MTPNLLLAGESPVEFISLGRWWSNDLETRSQTEIDIMGVWDKNSALFVEWKWTNEKVDIDVFETLVQRSGLFAYQKVHLFLHSKSGFIKCCMDKSAKLGNVSLVMYADIFS